ncbi:MAG: nitrile hydratase accessory protein [Candidatus Dormibacterales bacterium]
MSGGGREAADMPGAAALPRRNGELVFEAPWQSRAFGVALALHEQRLYEWDEFRDRLVEEIARGEDGAYYESWLRSLERLVLDRGLLIEGEFRARTAEFEAGARNEVF